MNEITHHSVTLKYLQCVCCVFILFCAPILPISILLHQFFFVCSDKQCEHSQSVSQSGSLKAINEYWFFWGVVEKGYSRNIETCFISLFKLIKMNFYSYLKNFLLIYSFLKKSSANKLCSFAKPKILLQAKLYIPVKFMISIKIMHWMEQNLWGVVTKN